MGKQLQVKRKPSELRGWRSVQDRTFCGRLPYYKLCVLLKSFSKSLSQKLHRPQAMWLLQWVKAYRGKQKEALRSKKGGRLAVPDFLAASLYGISLFRSEGGEDQG